MPKELFPVTATPPDDTVRVVIVGLVARTLEPEPVKDPLPTSMVWLLMVEVNPKYTVKPAGIENAVFAARALIAPPVAGYTRHGFAVLFLMLIERPTTVVGRITPAPAAQVVTFTRSVVTAVAVP